MGSLFDVVVGHVRACVLHGDRVRISADSRLVEDLQADSMDLMALVDGLERALAIRISDAELGRATTIGELVALVHAKRALRAIPVSIEAVPRVDATALRGAVENTD